jgi:hypothetical protein
MNALGTRIEAGPRNCRTASLPSRIHVIFVARAPLVVPIQYVETSSAVSEPSRSQRQFSPLHPPAEVFKWVAKQVDPDKVSGLETGSAPLAPELKMVEFSLEMPAAKTVQLAADFTGWGQSPINMIRFGDGVWSTSVPLPAGIYAYRFLVDGHWYDDPRMVLRQSHSTDTGKAIIQVK